MLYDDVYKHHVIANFYQGPWLNVSSVKVVRRDVDPMLRTIVKRHVMIAFPFCCVCTHVRIPCESCNRNLRSHSCFDKHKTNKLRGKNMRAERNCTNCGSLLDRDHKHECFKPYCEICQRNREIGHLCSMKPLVNVLPRSDNVLFVFYDFETAQDFRFCNRGHVQSRVSSNFTHTAKCSLISM